MFLRGGWVSGMSVAVVRDRCLKRTCSEEIANHGDDDLVEIFDPLFGKDARHAGP